MLILKLREASWKRSRSKEGGHVQARAKRLKKWDLEPMCGT